VVVGEVVKMRSALDWLGAANRRPDAGSRSARQPGEGPFRMRGFLVAAPHSGSGKTTMTLGLLRALRERGVALAPAKAGPDYIDPAFHTAASGKTCINLDPWAMRPDLIRILAERHAAGDRLLAVEGMMGLFDSAADGAVRRPILPRFSACRCLRRRLRAHGALDRGARRRVQQAPPDVLMAGVILNRAGSARHEEMLRDALEPTAACRCWARCARHVAGTAVAPSGTGAGGGTRAAGELHHRCRLRRDGRRRSRPDRRH
jgi:hypothetical protein